VPRFLTVATTVRTTAATVPTPLVRRRLERATSAAHLALGRAAFEEATIAGRALTVAAAIDQAIAVLIETIAGSGGLTVLRSPGEAPGEPRGGRRSPVAAPGGAELSRRQREVLRLLVDGLTDPEIGEVLGVGARTVESHVSAILTKLGVHARTAAVAHAVRHGLA